MLTSLSRRAARALARLALAVALVSPLPAGADAADPSAIDKAVETFNTAMLSIFHRGQDTLSAQTLPIMVIARNVTVITADGQKTYPRDAPQYQNLKSASHVVLGIIGAVTPWPEGDAGKTRWQRDFTTMSTQIDTFLAAIDASGGSDQGLDGQRQMLQMARDFTTKALHDGTLTRAAVSQVINDMRPVWAKNMRAAARAELGSLHQAVTAARADITDEQWAKMYVVHHGGSSVKDVNVVQLYLQRVAPEKTAAGQVLFAEGIHGTDDMAKHAGYVRMQRLVGAWAFGDPMRMEVDLLGYEAGAALDEMIPAPPPNAIAAND